MVGESGAGKSLTGARHHRPARAAGPHRRRAKSASKAGASTTCRTRRCAGIRGRSIGVDLPGPAHLAQPALHHRPRSSTRRSSPICRCRTREARERALALLREVGIPAPRRAIDALSAPVLRRHAPARGDRARARAPSRSCSIADEPTTALDVSIQAQIIALLKRLGARARHGGDADHARHGRDRRDRATASR